MIKIAMSPAASALLRALAARSGSPRDRILLTNVESIDWRSLTFAGERHQLDLRIVGPHSRSIVERMCEGLADAEFSIPGIIVADIVVSGKPDFAADGSSTLTIDALTISED